jgi:hypothetical protein
MKVMTLLINIKPDLLLRVLDKTPIDISIYLSKNRGKKINQLEYSWIIRSLLHIINYTRLDIAYSVSKLSRFISNPSMNYWKAIKRVLKYLMYNLDYGLHYTDYSAILKRYSDSNWISDTKDLKSTNGYIVILGGAIVS